MLVMINIKIDPRMKAAIQRLAEKQFMSMSGLIKQAIEKYLEDRGIDWREDAKVKKPKK